MRSQVTLSALLRALGVTDPGGSFELGALITPTIDVSKLLEAEVGARIFDESAITRGSQAYSAEASMNANAGETAKVWMFNPIGSNVVLIIDSIITGAFGSPIDSQLFLFRNDQSGGALSVNVRNKEGRNSTGDVRAQGQPRQLSSAGAPPSSGGAAFAIVGTSIGSSNSLPWNWQFTQPWRIYPGQGLGVWENLAQSSLQVMFQWREEALIQR